MLKEYGLELIRLDLPFRLNHVNCFIAEDENGWKVIDAGLHNKETVERWNKELKGKHVTDIIITHYHPDHFGYAGGLQQKHGAKLWMSKIDAENGLQAWSEPFLDQLEANYKLAGISTEIGIQMAENTRSFIPRVTPYPTFDHYLEEGEKLPLGKFEYEVIFTPGHSDGLVTFYNREKKMLLGTDHILPKITPNISYWFHGDPNPLDSYYKSLDKVGKLKIDFVVPSHGKPFHDGNKRIEELKAHHDERLELVMDILGNGAKTVFDASEKLFNKKLTVHEVRFAIGETMAHLEYLRLKDDVQRELKDGVYWYYS